MVGLARVYVCNKLALEVAFVLTQNAYLLCKQTPANVLITYQVLTSIWSRGSWALLRARYPISTCLLYYYVQL